MDGILGARDGVLDVLGGVRAGDEDAVGAEVEGLLNANAVVRAADADDCLRAARVRRRDDMAQLLGVDGRVCCWSTSRKS